MTVSFDQITVGGSYSRNELAKVWGYSGIQALARGVVTPRENNKIILFVTEEKESSAEQYQDSLVGDLLHWEGPTDHFAEDRMIESSKSGDEIHVFYREKHHTDFVYLGRFEMSECERHTKQPSKFTLKKLPTPS